MKILVTGGAGFIGSAFIRNLIAETNHYVLNIDKLSYASNLESLRSVETNERYSFVELDLLEREKLSEILTQFEPERVVHFAAETHVDRSISDPMTFISNNVNATAVLLECLRDYLDGRARLASDFRFHHVSTDEVFGDISNDAASVLEGHVYRPSSPYSASKAASDHLVFAWHRTFGIPVCVTHCTNNYGPWQYPEKLIPHFVSLALAHKSLPIYGDGQQIRDWLHVEDHAVALKFLIEGHPKHLTYNISGDNECTNVSVIDKICEALRAIDKRLGKPAYEYTALKTFVTDRLGHDRRYSLNSNRIREEFNWQPKISFAGGLSDCVNWFYDNQI